MERIKELDRYQKTVLILVTAMVLGFTVLYYTITARVGFSYQDTILLPGQENGSTVYTGTIQQKQAKFTVSPDKTVIFQYGGKTYGPYTAKEDPTAIPKDAVFGDSMTGVELRCGEEILFRGGVLWQSEPRLIYREDGEPENFGISVFINGVHYDEDGNVIDPMEPSTSTILDLMGGPELTHKGQWLGWLGGAFVCIFTAVTILFADELFRWELAFRVYDPDQVEPSDWEITGRYISWTVLPIMAAVLFIKGLG